MKKQFYILVIIALISILSVAIISNFDYHGMTLINAQQQTIIDSDNNTNNTNIIDYRKIPYEKVRVGDIDIAYKILGNGDPILLIMGYSGSKDDWDQTFITRLSVNHSVIVFDNRGVSDSTLGTKYYTINQLAEDIVGLLNVLNINQVDILGYSMGGMVAQQLTLDHADRVDDLILYATHCGTIDQTYNPPQKLLEQFGNLTDKPNDNKQRFVPYQFPTSWINENRDFYDQIFNSFKLPPNNVLEKQKEAMFKWISPGSCDKLSKISQDTLIIVGTADKIIPSINSEIFKDKIKGAEVQTFVDGGHALMFQFPERLNKEIHTFLNK